MKQKSVVLVFDLALNESHAIWQGVLSYVQRTTPWILHFVYPDYYMDGVESISELHPDGVIALSGGGALNGVGRPRKPIVWVCPCSDGKRGPCVAHDDVAAGKMGAEYFLERGFEHFGFVGNSNNLYSDERLRGFQQTLRAAGYDCQVFDVQDQPSLRPEKSRTWSRRQAWLVQWLSSLRRPAAILACNDLRAWRTAEVCRAAGILVPEEVALLGVGNEGMFCQSAHPPLSSIVLSSEKLGYEAAALLDRLMRGEKAPRRPMLLPPLRVESRQSSDVLAVRDPDVARAMAFIRERAGEPIQVEDVLERVAISRRALERKFKAATGRTPQELIGRAHLERAKHLLSGTDMAVSAVAVQSGFQSGERLAVVFRQKLGLSPSDYRRKFGAAQKL